MDFEDHNLDFFGIWADRLREPEQQHREQHNVVGGEQETRPSAVWVFGYGSLCWYPGFEYSKCITGYIRGYTRKFWQGNTTHRGTPEKVSMISYYFFQLFLVKIFLEL